MQNILLDNKMNATISTRYKFSRVLIARERIEKFRIGNPYPRRRGKCLNRRNNDTPDSGRAEHQFSHEMLSSHNPIKHYLKIRCGDTIITNVASSNIAPSTPRRVHFGFFSDLHAIYIHIHTYIRVHPITHMHPIFPFVYDKFDTWSVITFLHAVNRTDRKRSKIGDISVISDGWSQITSDIERDKLIRFAWKSFFPGPKRRLHLRR